MGRRQAYQRLSKVFDTSSVTSMLKALAILSDTTVRGSAVQQGGQNHTENQKKDQFSQDEVTSLFLASFAEISLATEIRL